jgi:hypothetical protein
LPISDVVGSRHELYEQPAAARRWILTSTGEIFCCIRRVLSRRLNPENGAVPLMRPRFKPQGSHVLAQNADVDRYIRAACGGGHRFMHWLF